MKQIISIYCLLFISLRSINAQFARCRNPNQRTGVCVSIYDCQTVLSVLQREPLQSFDFEFVRASQCYGGYGTGNMVCCTADTGFSRSQPQPQYPDNSFYWDSPQRTLLRPLNNNNNNNFNDNSPFVRLENGNGISLREQREQRRQPSENNFVNFNSINAPSNTDRSGNSDLLPRPPSCGGVTISSKIYGGSEADLNEFPWMVLLEYNRRAGNTMSTNCAGTLINQRYVVTAAHCTQGEIEKRIGTLTGIRLGEHDTTRQVDCNQFACAPEALRAGIEEIITHERYKPRAANQEFDIALIRLDYAIRYSNSIRPICLPSAVKSNVPKPGQQLIVAGWGRTLNAARSPTKQKLNVVIVEAEKCRNKFGERKVKIVDSQICAGAKYGEDSCDGDSGGPLMVYRDGAWVLEGIVSFGFKCGLRDWPGVYTRVGVYTDWIKNNIRS